ncbi:hypothetical protein CH35J_004795 [Colletotrichum higginsianum]|uniref:DUF6546 domain-containing protein n=1 Tax=Colletotrichum higginsianum TaxID=80884 RepID=A0A4T0WAZ8_9PEZI|nr:hypothetical protein CH35J_004795 [Colletotrichum higginsianum]
MPLRSDALHALDDGLSHGNGAGLQLPQAILPPEIRLMVLEELERLVEGRSRLSHFSAVSAEWRAFFQPRIFETLSIRHPGPDVTQLDANVRGDRTRLVKRISLHVTTDEYDARHDFDRPESGSSQRANDTMLQEALHELFRVLSKWGYAEDAHGISLDISVSSRSDAEHQLNHRNDRPHLSRSRVHSQDFERCLLGSLFGPGLARPPLPRVPIIKRLSMSNQNYRSFSAESLPRILLSLCCLETVNYAPGRSIDAAGRIARSQANMSLFQCVENSTTVKSVHLSESRSEMYVKLDSQNPYSRNLVLASVKASYGLRTLAICHAIDAREFFQCHEDANRIPSAQCATVGSWPVLERLVLTTETGDLVAGASHVDSVLLMAATAALQMPSLKTMEIWASRIDHHFVFRYYAGAYGPTVCVCATWPVKLGAAVLDAWQQAAGGHAQQKQRQLRHKVASLDPGPMEKRSMDYFCHKIRPKRIMRDW